MVVGGRGGGALAAVAATLGAECHAAASLKAAWARAARVGAVVIANRGRQLNWHGNNWHGDNWHNGHHHNGNDVIFIGSFGFPWWWGWGWGPSWGWGYGYPYYGYGYYPYGYGGAYGYGYGYGGYPYGNGYGYNNGYGNGYGAEYQSHYGNSSRSRVSELQRRLSRAGYYHGSIDGVLGPQTRRAIRAYEQDHDNAS